MCKDGQIARRLEQRARELATIAKSSPVARERNPGEHATYEALLRRASSVLESPS